MAEVRTTSSTGGQKGTKLARFDLIPVGPLTELAEHFGVGASKYADHQWRNGYEWSKTYSALSRHLTAWWAGLDFDVCSNDPTGCSHVDAEGNPFTAIREDACFNHTGSHHLAAVAWHAFAGLEFAERFPEHDDRFKPRDSNALESEDPLVDIEGFVGTDRPLLDRLVYWSKRLRDAWDSDEHAHKGDEIEYAEDNLDTVMNLLRERNLDHVEEPGPLGEGWETVGYVDETQNWPDSNSFAILKNPDYDLPFREPSAFVNATVEWKDPEPRTLSLAAAALDRLAERMNIDIDKPEKIEVTQDQYDALKARCVYETGGKWSLPDGAIGTWGGIPVVVKEEPDFPRVKVDHWVEDYDAEYPKFGAFQTFDVQPYVKAMDEHIRKLANISAGYALPTIFMAGLPLHRTFVVDSDGEIEIEDLLQDAFNRRGLITLP